jgi:hypothetical protein
VEPHRSPVERDELQELQLESSSPARLKPANIWPKTRTRSHSEASVMHVSDFAETRENILRIGEKQTIVCHDRGRHKQWSAIWAAEDDRTPREIKQEIAKLLSWCALSERTPKSKKKANIKNDKSLTFSSQFIRDRIEDAIFNGWTNKNPRFCR